jgi:hypothetical protein
MLTQDEVESLLPGNVLLANCSQCGRLLFGRLTYAEAASFLRKLAAPVPLPPARIAGRISGRPYCSSCLEPNGRTRTPADEEEVPDSLPAGDAEAVESSDVAAGEAVDPNP